MSTLTQTICLPSQPVSHLRFVVRVQGSSITIDLQIVEKDCLAAVEVAAMLDANLSPLPSGNHEFQQACVRFSVAPRNDGLEDSTRSWTSTSPNEEIGNLTENRASILDDGLYPFEDSSTDGIPTYNQTSEIVQSSSNFPASDNLAVQKYFEDKATSITTEGSYALPTSPISTTIQEHTYSSRHHCPWTNCASRFRRAADRDRHFVTKHGKPIKYFCPIANCSRGRGLWRGYSREDKLTEHSRKVHIRGEA